MKTVRIRANKMTAIDYRKPKKKFVDFLNINVETNLGTTAKKFAILKNV